METNQVTRTPKGFLKTISAIHLALLTGPVLFAIVAFVQTRKTGIEVNDANDPLMSLVPILAIGGFIASNVLFNQQVDDTVNKPSLKDKLMAYKTALLIRYASLEAPALFGVGAYLVRGNFLFLIIAMIVIAYLAYIKPSRIKLVRDLHLKHQNGLELSADEI